VKATAIIPVKRFGAAKQRLLEALDRPQRAALVKAMLSDVLSAIEGAKAVERVIIVTGEARAERLALEAAKRMRTPLEVLQEPTDHGHSEAATLGIIRAMALDARCVALLPGDCPLLDADELDAVLGRMQEDAVAVVPDRHGTGTNALVLAPADAIAPAFGPGSRKRHVERAERRGLAASVEQVDSLALDLDTPDDLAALEELLASTPDRAPASAAELQRIRKGS
jgi:2-phospho-L-lactate guanylyltransferase